MDEWTKIDGKCPECSSANIYAGTGFPGADLEERICMSCGHSWCEQPEEFLLPEQMVDNHRQSV